MIDLTEQLAIVHAEACREFWLAFGWVVAHTIILVFSLYWLSKMLSKYRKTFRAIFFVSTLLFARYAVTKVFYGNITFPRVDAETWYLRDNGSYITNDYVHVSYTKNPVVPDDAPVFVSALESSYTNNSDWADHSITVTNGTIATLGTEFDLPFPLATNYNWQVYTTWTPGPTTHTNGVAYVVWKIGTDKSINDIVPYRTGVYTNNVRVAPNPALTNRITRTSVVLEAIVEEIEGGKDD